MICEFHITIMPCTPFDYSYSNRALQNFCMYPIASSTSGEDAEQVCLIVNCSPKWEKQFVQIIWKGSPKWWFSLKDYV